MTIITTIIDDISTLSCDAIVNAANPLLLGGGGVDGYIHQAAGPELLEECKKLAGCDVGDAKITKGYNLRAKYIIHAVGPIWYGGAENECDLLASCYQKSLLLCETNNIKSVALPCISTGCYNFPHELAATIAVREVKLFLQKLNNIKSIVFCCYSQQDYDIYQLLLNEPSITHNTPV